MQGTPRSARSPRPSTVVLTGATGFIGRAICGALLKRGDHVHLAGAGSHGAEPRESFELDLSLADQVEHVDAVVHAAALTDVHADFEALARVNVVGTVRALKFAREKSARTFVYLSTGGVYGYRADPISEDVPVRPIDAYSLSKYQGELWVQAFGDAFTTTILRLFFPYGRGQGAARLIPRLIGRIGMGQPITIYNNGTSPRINPIHLDDVVDAVIRGLSADRPAVLNIAGAEIVSLRALCDRLGDLLGRRPTYITRDSAEPRDLVGDVARARGTLGFDPQTTLDRGLASMLADP